MAFSGWTLLPLLSSRMAVARGQIVMVPDTLDNTPFCAHQCIVDKSMQASCDTVDIASNLYMKVKLQNALSECIQTSCPFADQVVAANIETELCAACPKAFWSSEIVRITIAGCAIVSTAIALRLCARKFHAEKLYMDNYATMLAAVSLAILPLVNLCTTHVGLSMHSWAMVVDRGTKILKLFYFNSIVYMVLSVVGKIAILLVYFRILPDRTFGRIVHGLTAVLALHGVFYVLLTTLQCLPVESIWARYMPHRKCVNVDALVYSSGILSILEDVAILLLPGRSVWQLNIHRRRRLTLLGLFGIGSLACLTSILRLKYMVQYIATVDVTWDSVEIAVCSTIEQFSVMFWGSLPTLRTLLLSGMPRLFASTRDRMNRQRRWEPRIWLTGSSHRSSEEEARLSEHPEPHPPVYGDPPVPHLQRVSKLLRDSEHTPSPRHPDQSAEEASQVIQITPSKEALTGSKVSQRKRKGKNTEPQDFGQEVFTRLNPSLRAKVQYIRAQEALQDAWRLCLGLRQNLDPLTHSQGFSPLQQIGIIQAPEPSNSRPKQLRHLIERWDTLISSHAASGIYYKIARRVHLIELAERFRKLKAMPVSSEGTANDRFCDELFPETTLNQNKEQTPPQMKKREENKTKLEYWIRLGTRFEFMVQRFGYGVLLFPGRYLADRQVNALQLRRVKDFLDYIDLCHPGLKNKLANLSIILPRAVHHGLPLQPLVIETIPYDKISEIRGFPLEEMFQYPASAIIPLANCIQWEALDLSTCQKMVHDCTIPWPVVGTDETAKTCSSGGSVMSPPPSYGNSRDADKGSVTMERRISVREPYDRTARNEIKEDQKRHARQLKQAQAEERDMRKLFEKECRRQKRQQAGKMSTKCFGLRTHIQALATALPGPAITDTALRKSHDGISK